MLSVVLIIPADQKAAGDSFLEAAGWGPESYTIPLSNNSMSITHYALRADVEDYFKISEQAISELISDFSGIDHTLWGKEHLDYVCAKHALNILL